ncbi:MAG: DUF4292 domain-containing protein [Deltaproteobacteria bacterium]
MRTWGLIAVLLFGAFGCPKKPPEQTDMRPLPKPAELLESLRADNDRKNLRALGRVTYYGDQGRVRLKAVLLAERPGRFRIETLSPLEQPIDVMACDGETLWLLSQGRLKTGRATPQNISRLLPLSMKASEVVDTLLGGVPTSDRFDPAKVERIEDTDALALELTSNLDERVWLRVDPVKRVVEEMKLFATNHAERVHVKFDDFEATPGGRPLPRSMEIRMDGLDVRIKLTEADVDVPLDARLFTLVPPDGVEAEPL